MKVLLFTENKIYPFYFSTQTAGSYSFDFDENEEAKLINIEEREGKWLLYSTRESRIIADNNTIDAIEIECNKYYQIQRYGKIHTIYIKSMDENDLSSYMFNENIQLSIGADNSNNVVVASRHIMDLKIDIRYRNGYLTLVQNKLGTYVNNHKMTQLEYVINPEDVINVFGVSITFFNHMFVIDAPKNEAIVNVAGARIEGFTHKPSNYKMLDVKDEDLYKKEDYYSKSPRIRRQIEEKEIKIDLPPKPREGDDLPLILTIGPMLSMGAVSLISILSVVNNISTGKATLSDSWMSLIPSIITLATTFLWPFIIRLYNEHMIRVDRRKLAKQYADYLTEKKDEIEKEAVLETSILRENLLSCEDCIKIINFKRNNFWDKRIEQNDFLEVRVGIGDVPLKAELNIREDEFTVDQDFLKKEAIQLSKEFEKICNVPVGYSFFENNLTAIMGKDEMRFHFLSNLILQLATYYCYDELKFIVLTNEENEKKWEYLKYSNYVFNNSKTLRFFATNLDEGEKLSSALNPELTYRVNTAKEKKEYVPFKPYYIVVVDDYNTYKKLNFLQTITESDQNIGYSVIILESALNKLPSKCLNFINLSEGKSGILKNSFDDQEIIDFTDEINRNINMMDVFKTLSDIPVELEDTQLQMPNSISLLDMEKVGKVEQLNVLSRWRNNDSTKSLKTEIGVKEDGNYMYLDLHEKYHGPHGLIAGMTGSGKSEFIITYILSMSMNYSPDDISFVLIDYKGGGLAFAFENISAGMVLPHLAGTITNLDKNELNRTLISIDSEIKRRQVEFNKARDALGESTIDIYKYQKYFHEGKLQEPIPHLFIICDEFAELKSQQPEFMDDLISVARIGRSLGVHLILATQKPSGVVNDQIWSNSKFKVCLKVQDEIDSNEMLKKPDAANIKQTGRFFLQVGFDEYYEMGQSAWCGAKYFPSEKVVKPVDLSVNIIDNLGVYIKSIQGAPKQDKKEAQGDQLTAVLNEVIRVAKEQDKKVRKLWLENVPDVVLVDELEKKYNITYEPYKVKALIGEYDAPEKQEQGLVMFDLLENGNTIIYGIDGVEREKLLFSIVYSTTKNFSSDELQIYAMDFGSEALRSFLSLPHVGDMVFNGEDDRIKSLYDILRNEISERKKTFINYGGTYKNYIANSGEKKPLMMVIINNYDTIIENASDFAEDLPEIVRDSSRYGIVFVLTANGNSSVNSRVNQNFTNLYALHLKDDTDRYNLFRDRSNVMIKSTLGRGMFETDIIHEFQTASITADEAAESEFLINYVNEQKAKNKTIAKRIPTMPEHVTLETIEKEITDLTAVPIGISKDKLEIKKYDFASLLFSVIASTRVENTKRLLRSLITIFKKIGTKTIVVDTTELLLEDKDFVDNYYDNNFDQVAEALNEYMDKLIEQNTPPKISESIIVFMGLDKFISKLEDKTQVDILFEKIKSYEKVSVILVENNNKLKNYAFEPWYNQNIDNSNGIWVATGMQDQNLFNNSLFNKEQSLEYKNDMGFFVSDGIATLTKFIDFYGTGDDEDE